MMLHLLSKFLRPVSIIREVVNKKETSVLPQNASNGGSQNESGPIVSCAKGQVVMAGYIEMPGDCRGNMMDGPFFVQRTMSRQAKEEEK